MHSSMPSTFVSQQELEANLHFVKCHVLMKFPNIAIAHTFVSPRPRPLFFTVLGSQILEKQLFTSCSFSELGVVIFRN